MKHDNFSVLITHTEGAFQARVIASPEGETAQFTPLNAEALTEARALQEMMRTAARLQREDAAPEMARALGTALFDALFPDDIRSLLDRNLGRIAANPDQGLRIRLHTDATPTLVPLTALPWELLFDPRRRVFINQDKDTPVVRHPSTSESGTPADFSAPLRILVAMANPRGTRLLDLARERRIIEKHVAHQRGVRAHFIENASLQDVQAALAHNTYHVLHFMGHGSFTDEGGVLTFDDGSAKNQGDGRGRIHDVPSEVLSAILADHPSLSMVFLNACQTARDTRDHPAGGTTRQAEPSPRETPRRLWRDAPPWALLVAGDGWTDAPPWGRATPVGIHPELQPTPPVPPAALFTPTRPAPTSPRSHWLTTVPWKIEEAAPASTAWIDDALWARATTIPTPAVPAMPRPLPPPAPPTLPTLWHTASPWEPRQETTGDGSIAWGQTLPWVRTTPDAAAPPDDDGVFFGFASALVHAGLPAVVAMQFAISDEAAIAFARGFYEQLQLGSGIDEAVTVGRKAIITTDFQSTEWFTPVLFMRAPEGILFQRAPSPLLASHRNLQVLLNRVKLFWIEGVLKPSTLRGKPIRLRMETAPDAVTIPLHGGAPETLEDTPIGEAFDAGGRALLLLGAPGSGKTTTLLALAQALMPRAEGTLNEPVPVVFDLPNWSNTRLPLADWMAAELQDKYQISEKLVQSWLSGERHRLVPLLDGLDAVDDEQRAACVQAINDFLAEPASVGLAVTCRQNEYDALEVKLDCQDGLRLLPLTDAQIDTYLDDAGADAFKAVLDRHAAAREQARLPVMLDTMSRAFDEADALKAASPTEPLHPSRLFDTYLDRMFTRELGTLLPHPQQKMIKWLGWIADRLTTHHQGLFMMEQIRASWISSPLQRWLSLAVFSVVFGFLLAAINAIVWYASDALDPMACRPDCVFPSFWFWLTLGIIWTLCVGVADQFKVLNFSPSPHWRRRLFTKSLRFVIFYELWLVIGLLATIPFGLGFSTVNGLWISGLMVVLIYVVHGGGSGEVRTVQALGWSGKHALRGLVIGGQFGLLIWAVYTGYYLLSSDLTFTHLANNLWLYPPLGAVGGFLFNGFQGEFRKGATRINQGVRFLIGNAVRTGFVIGPVLAVVCGAIFYARFNRDFALPGALLFGFVALLAAMLWFGLTDVLRHFSLRLVLRLGGHLPPRCDAFFDDAVQRGLMHKVGGGYRFINRFLQEHLAIRRKTG